ncbi:hypothetical protein HC823_02420 [Candidatus Gracilibacteria bacterium]|nr:hypothetical protein [Candidatus Gracilibacteria bacterium]
MKKVLLATGLFLLTGAVLFTGVSAIQNNVRAGSNPWGDSPLNWRTFRSYRFEKELPEEVNFYRKIERKVQTPIAKFDYFSNRLAGGNRVDSLSTVAHHPRQHVFASLVAYTMHNKDNSGKKICLGWMMRFDRRMHTQNMHKIFLSGKIVHTSQYPFMNSL